MIIIKKHCIHVNPKMSLYFPELYEYSSGNVNVELYLSN